MKNNHAFIDSQNLNLGIKELGWRLDQRKFRVYLRHKYKVQKAYLFIGYLPENKNMYRFLQEAGYVLIFKPVLKPRKGPVKGNVDADLVLQAMIDFDEYDKAVVVTSDGDFYSLINYLYDQDKLEKVLSPNKKNCSILLQRAAKDRIDFMDNLQGKLEYK